MARNNEALGSGMSAGNLEENSTKFSENGYTMTLSNSYFNETTDPDASTRFELATAGLQHVCLTTQEISLTINIVAICVGVVIIFGNFLVLFVLFRYPARHFAPFNWLLGHLAVADFVIGITVFWWYGLAEVLQIPVTNFQKVGFYGASIVSVIASLEGLMTIALDRYCLILKQHRYTTTITKKRLGIAIAIMWLFPSTFDLIIPLSGWSCVDECDCRIHNVRPDDVYCFGEQCSQILPPLTKLQLFITGVTSCILFVITIILYIVIFYGVKKQSKKLKLHRQSRASTPKSPKFSTEKNVFQFANTPESPREAPQKTVTGWRNNLATVDELTPPTPTKTQEFTFNYFGAFKNQVEDEPTNKESPTTPMFAPNKVMGRQESNTTTLTELSTPTPTTESKVMGRQESNTTTITELSTPTPTTESVRFQANHSRTDSESGENGSIPNGDMATVQVVMRPKTLTAGKDKVEKEIRKSRTTFMTSKFNRFTRRSKRRTTASRKRDLRVMRSMFIILSVFIATTGPLMIFVIYTYPHNDRDLKEIFNILLQVTTLNSLLNPFLYFWRIPHMRKKLRKLIHADSLERKWRESYLWQLKHPGKRPIQKSKEESEASWESADASIS